MISLVIVVLVVPGWRVRRAGADGRVSSLVAKGAKTPGEQRSGR